jgi:hypothetical protein
MIQFRKFVNAYRLLKIPMVQADIDLVAARMFS